jgi:hypothetical protein
MTIWTMYIACSVTKATNTHSQYIIVIAFPRQPCRYERAQCYVSTYIACLVNSLYLRPRSGLIIKLWLRGQWLREYALRTGHTTSLTFAKKGGVWAPLTSTRFSVARHNLHSSWLSLKLMDTCLPKITIHVNFPQFREKSRRNVITVILHLFFVALLRADVSSNFLDIR